MSPDVPEELEQGRVDALKGDVPLESAEDLPTTFDLAEAKKKDAAAQEVVDRNALRKPLFWVIVCLLGLSYASTTGMMWVYLAHVHYIPDHRIMIAWISAAIAQLVGLTLVIARYLFAPPRGL